MKRFLFLSFCFLMTGYSYSQGSIQTINLPQGWSMFSTYIQPANTEINNVMLPVVSNVIIVKNGAGNVYWPQYGVNSIGNMQVGNGYQVKMLTTQNLTITGTQLIPENTPVYLSQGWNIIGYLRIYSSKMNATFTDIVNNVDIVKDDLGNVYWPGYQIDNIKIINPGKAYQVRMLTADTLTYASNTFQCGADVTTDFDGNLYNTVQIGTQCWMKENMKTTHYADGTTLVDGTNAGNNGLDFTTKYYFDYNNNPANTITYGKLYTWAAVMNGAATSITVPSGVQGICPTGWHVPSDEEWKILEGEADSQYDYPNVLWNYTGWRGNDAGKNLKATSGWYYNGNGTDLSGFSALPAGNSNDGGYFYGLDNYIDLWSSSEYSATFAWCWRLDYSTDSVDRSNFYKNYGFSVRCLRDN